MKTSISVVQQIKRYLESITSHNILLGIQFILAILSLFGLFFVLRNAINLPFLFTDIGFLTFVSLFEPYEKLFAATLIVFSTKLAIDQINLTSKTSNASAKISSRSGFISSINQAISESYCSELFVKTIRLQLGSIHDFLFDTNFGLKSKEDVRFFLEIFVSGCVVVWELGNRNFQQLKVFPSSPHSYSYSEFKIIVFMSLDITQCYLGIHKDFKEIYIEIVEAEMKKYGMFTKIDDREFSKRCKELNIKETV